MPHFSMDIPFPVDKVNQRLYDSMICRIHRAIQGEFTNAIAIIGLIAVWCDHPRLKYKKSWLKILCGGPKS